jgi:hypothetical protein
MRHSDNGVAAAKHAFICKPLWLDVNWPNRSEGAVHRNNRRTGRDCAD